MRKYIKDVCVYYQGEYARCLKAIVKKEKILSQSNKHNYVVYGDEQYPKCFYELQNPPLCLFYWGNLSLFNRLCISVIGSRTPSDYAMDMTKRIVSTLSDYYVIVSGFAKGIDSIAQDTAHYTIGFLGSGLSCMYPKSSLKFFNRNKETICILSEYPDFAPVKKHHFPWRNRLIAATGEKILVMQAGQKSGTMHTVSYGLELGREIYCLAHPYLSCDTEGGLELVNSGSFLLTKETVLDMIRKQKGE